MKVYTKKGDKGSTQLIGGKRVQKNSIRINAYGSVDELNSFLGLIRDQEISEQYKSQIITTQENLFTIGAILATDPKGTKMVLPDIQVKDIELLENWIDEMDEELPPMRNFVLPGGHIAVSFAHVARCVCRRAERCIIDLNEQEKVPEITIAFMNRLSDYLFVLSRKLSKDLGASETPWIPK